MHAELDHRHPTVRVALRLLLLQLDRPPAVPGADELLRGRVHVLSCDRLASFADRMERGSRVPTWSSSTTRQPLLTTPAVLRGSVVLLPDPDTLRPRQPSAPVEPRSGRAPQCLEVPLSLTELYAALLAGTVVVLTAAIAK